MIILIQCRDQVGLVAAISGVLANESLNIVSLREHVDKQANLFFMRVEVEQQGESAGLEEKLLRELPSDAVVKVNPSPQKKIVVLVTKEYHCLADILIRNYFGSLGAEVQAVIGHYDTLEDICRRFEIPFHKVEVPASARVLFEQQLEDLIQQYSPDFLVLAKFMRILSPEFVAKYPMRIINIHHSFLPAFAGAHPYRQAFERGVKLIGATAHFVTDHLDEGPILAQQIIPVTHSATTADMVKAGKEIETAVLARGLRLVFEDRIFVYGNKTVVFE
ncbi:formyltetrahydrofolate deformylase [Pseudoflavitalea sp. G-6-1-2]|uniref:formyltetrahydrofolate deformylase n=1 Tax=Pseudoflavitalea sp. G-6-1-2 TaxID=2728841 RepID=UPI00146C2B44|nr:formyltetrahydrofolate deformylase [Pseudoflavitalea sp. G-6-1-2]NML21876.1 formyltetrahydrofolate deformylase [Pseudoflavitalea sp. G-6-1-2]